MIASHTRALIKAQELGEPAARELEIQRLRTAMQRAEELSRAAAEALESAM